MSFSSTSTGTVIGIGFVTEAQIEEKRKARQEEWEKVRKPEEPLEAPAEEPHDGRSLFDRLQEQKNLKQEEFEESRKLKNLVKVLDDEECEFLDYVDQARVDEERRKRAEEARELKEFRDAVSKLREQSQEEAILYEIRSAQQRENIIASKRSSSTSESDDSIINVKKPSQSQLLAGVVVKRKQSLTPASATATDNNQAGQDAKKPKQENPPSTEATATSTKIPAIAKSNPSNPIVKSSGILSALASYGSSSSSSDENSDQEDESEKKSKS